MRRLLLAALGLLAVGALAAQSAGAQDGYEGGWTDPRPEPTTRDDKPLAYLRAVQVLTGQVSHPNGIRSVSAVLVPNESAASDCEAQMDPNIEVEHNGTTATFRVYATFPCNLVYELRATAQANADEGITGGAPGPYAMPLLLAVAIPPEPVSSVDALLEIDDDDLTVTLEWPAGPEPDLLGYVVNRTIGEETETLGQVDAAEHPAFVDEGPAAGEEIRYDVIAVREGPDDDVEQVAASPASVTVDVPSEEDEDVEGADGTGDGGADPQLAGEATPTDGGSAPAPGSLSSVRVHGQPVPPTTPTTLDTGYSDTIDYGELGEVGEATGPLGDDSVVAIYDEGTTGSPWRDEETMTFVAGGLAVLSGAGTILTVTRRAARVPY